MLYYFDGQPVQIGDSVDFDGEPATVFDIRETEDQIIAAGMDEPAVGFQTGTIGQVYQSPNDRGWDGVVLIERAH